ncbi:MAG TPA: hypothetical protein VFM93_14390 [Candidatus Limnocylindria bacterium]|nr:hypothetical protein [Candidatus Limnocylindria bacterium]
MTARPARDARAAGWIAPRLHPFAQDVGSVVPPGFEDHARVFHPARRGDAAVPWREIARANGRTVHREMQFGSIAGTWSRASPDPSLWTADPETGSLPLEIVRELVAVLRRHTGTPERCWIAVWEGFGDLDLPAGTPRFEHPGRAYYLLEGRVDDVTRPLFQHAWHYRSPNLWWPDDRAWCVATEIDLTYTYVAGTVECIEAVLAAPGIEALRARLDDGITIASDTLNPGPRPPR